MCDQKCGWGGLHNQICSYWIAEFLKNSCEFPGTQIGILFVSGTGANHFARAKYQCRASWCTYSHYHTVESWWIVFRVSRSKINFLQVQVTAQIHGGHTILYFYRIDCILWLCGHWALCYYAGMWWQWLWRWRRLMWLLLLIADTLNSTIQFN